MVGAKREIVMGPREQVLICCSGVGGWVVNGADRTYVDGERREELGDGRG